MATSRRFEILVAALMLLVLGACGGPAPRGVNLVADTADGFESFDVPPVIVNFPAPNYPEEARSKALEGFVTVRVVVTERGAVDDVSVLKSSDEIFEAPALAVARTFRFEPATRAGRPVRCRVAVPVQFRLD